MYETALKKVEGLGSSHSGVMVWLVQRGTAGFLFFTVGWVLSALLMGHMKTYGAFQIWGQAPWNKAILIFLSVMLSIHTALGLQIVAEDYIHKVFLKVGLIFLIRFACVGLFLLSLISILSF